MSRALCLLLCLSSFAFGQSLNNGPEPSSSPVEVLYVFDSSAVTTYNINPQTLDAVEVSTTAMPSVQNTLAISPDGRFLYNLVNLGSSGQDEKLYVYDTEASGVPGDQPVQVMDASHLSGLAVNPRGAFAYGVVRGNQQRNGKTRFTIVRHVIDPATGKLSQPVTEATYDLDTFASANDCYFSIVGFNRSGTTMYDAIFCSGPHASGDSTYNERSVDLQSGALRPDKQIYGYGYYAGSGNAWVQIENDLLFAFVLDEDTPYSDQVDIYQIPNTTATVSCTASMWAPCGTGGIAAVHPSGKYVFLTDPTNSETDIGEVSLEAQQISQVNSLPFVQSMFGLEGQMLSPDGKIVYGSTLSSPYKLRIAGFDAATGEVSLGDIIQLPHKVKYWVAAQRY